MNVRSNSHLIDRITASYSEQVYMNTLRVIYLRFALRENKQAEEGSRLTQQPQQVHLSSWQDAQERGQLTVRYWARYPKGGVSEEP